MWGWKLKRADPLLAATLRGLLDAGLTPEECRVRLGKEAFFAAEQILAEGARAHAARPEHERAYADQIFRLILRLHRRGADVGKALKAIHSEIARSRGDNIEDQKAG